MHKKRPHTTVSNGTSDVHVPTGDIYTVIMQKEVAQLPPLRSADNGNVDKRSVVDRIAGLIKFVSGEEVKPAKTVTELFRINPLATEIAITSLRMQHSSLASECPEAGLDRLASGSLEARQWVSTQRKVAYYRVRPATENERDKAISTLSGEERPPSIRFTMQSEKGHTR